MTRVRWRRRGDRSGWKMALSGLRDQVKDRSVAMAGSNHHVPREQSSYRGMEGRNP